MLIPSQCFALQRNPPSFLEEYFCIIDNTNLMHQGEESLAQPLYLCTSTSMKDIQGALRGQARRAVLET